jgi:hypothetical protein
MDGMVLCVCVCVHACVRACIIDSRPMTGLVIAVLGEKK